MPTVQEEGEDSRSIWSLNWLHKESPERFMDMTVERCFGLNKKSLNVWFLDAQSCRHLSEITVICRESPSSCSFSLNLSFCCKCSKLWGGLMFSMMLWNQPEQMWNDWKHKKLLISKAIRLCQKMKHVQIKYSIFVVRAAFIIIQEVQITNLNILDAPRWNVSCDFSKYKNALT